MEFKHILAIGNTKIGRKTFSFSIPAIKTCLPSIWCIENCYACKGCFKFRSVKELYDRNMQLTAEINFSDKMIEEIENRKISMVRIHVSGDFYSIEYLNRWIKIIKTCKNTRFKVFTKRIDFLEKLEELNQLDNVFVHFSIDESNKHLINEVNGKLNYAVIENNQFQPVNHVNCLGSCKECNYSCWNKNINVLLHPH